MSFKKLYEGLGSNKSQRFWRFFLLCFLVSSLIAYGFFSDNIKISINKTIGNTTAASAGE